MRSWFFRIFAILSLFILCMFNLGVFALPNSAVWSSRAISSSIPYANMFLLNIVQAIIAVFLSSEFLQKDKKLDTAEVILVRPISNAAYILGKTFGVLFVFVSLNLVVLLMALVFNLIISDVPVNGMAYFLYPVLLSLPSLIFVLGFSFIAMMVFKNPAVTYILVFGFVFASMFFLQNKVYNLFDYVGLSLPMAYSDFIGFGKIHTLYLHRLAYFLVGAGGIVLTIRLLNRLPNSAWGVNLLSVLSAVLILSGVYCGYLFYQSFASLKQKREAFVQLNNSYFEDHTIEIARHQISLKHKGNRIEVESTMDIRNPRDGELKDSLVFSLNPGLKIKSLQSNGAELDFVKHKNVVVIHLPETLKKGQNLKLTWIYNGTIEEAVVALDADWDKYNQSKNVMMVKMAKRTAFVQNNFVMLTPATLWYPIAGVGFNRFTHLNRQIVFTRFNLTVDNPRNLTVISQGQPEIDENKWTFKPETKLSGLSVVMGNYQQQYVVSEDVTYSVFHLKNHDFYSQYFQVLGDTLPEIIKTLKTDFERELDLYYPFNRFSIVEVPGQYHSFPQQLSNAFEAVQPELVFLNEKGVGLTGADFANLDQQEKKRKRQGNNERTPMEVETSLFLQFAKNTFITDIQRASGILRGVGEGQNNRNKFENLGYDENPNSVFPMYYNHMAGFYSTRAPYFNQVLESYFKEGFQTSFEEMREGGMTDNEKANLLLQENSMTDILENESREDFGAVVTQKGNFLISLIQNEIGGDAFDYFIYYFIEDHAYKNLTFDDFKQGLQDSAKFNLEPYMNEWLHVNKVAKFLLSEVETFESKDDNGPVYLVKFKATNDGEATGVLYLNMRLAGGGGGFMGGSSSTEERFYVFKPGETKDIQISLLDQPRLIRINRMICSNIPATTMHFVRRPEQKDLPVEEYAHTVKYRVNNVGENEIVVDNEDKGFELIENKQVSKLKAYVEQNKNTDEDKYSTVRSYPPYGWTAITHTGFYGDYIQSAYYTQAGNGDMKAVWKANIEKSGTYEVYCYVPIGAMISSGWGSRQPGQGGGGRRGPNLIDEGYTYTFNIKTADGIKEEDYKIRRREGGWSRIGTYYFLADSTYVELTNDMKNGNRIFADAVKWVRVN